MREIGKAVWLEAMYCRYVGARSNVTPRMNREEYTTNGLVRLNWRDALIMAGVI